MENRIRQRPQVIPGSVDFYGYNPFTGSSLPSPASHVGSTVLAAWDHSEYIADVLDRNYLDKKRRGELILRPVIQWKRKLSDEETDMIVSLGSYSTPKSVPGWGAIRYTGPLLAGVVPNYYNPAARPLGYDDWISDAQSLTLQKCIGKMKQSDLCSGEFLGTLKQTLGMLRHPLESSLDILQKIATKKSNLIKSGFDGLTAGTSAWLEYRYGWAPLIMDLATIVAEINKRRDALLGQRLVVRDSMGTERSRDSDHVVALNGRYYPFKVHAVNKAKAKVRSQVFFRMRDLNQTQYLQKFLGLRLRDLPGALYELTPWSFVFDWFFALGAWLEYIIPDPTVEIEGSCTSVKEQFSTATTIVDCGFVANGYVVHPSFPTSPPVCTDDYDRYERVINQHTEFQWLASDGFGLSALQSVDAFALTLSAIAKKIPAMVSR